MGVRSAAVAMLLWSSASSAQVWTFEYSVGLTADEITSCNARIDFRDGTVILRIAGDEIDLFFFQQTLSVPPDTRLGDVALGFKAETIVATAYSSSSTTASTSSMFFAPAKADYLRLLTAMRNGSEMHIVFPDDSGFTVQLDQSNQALEQATKCWESNPTGPAGKNPFMGSSGNDPFN